MRDKRDTKTGDLLKATTRQGRYSEKQRELGRRQCSFWVTDAEKEVLAATLAELREKHTQ